MEYNINEIDINQIKDNKLYCELCGSCLDAKELLKNYEPIDIIRKLCSLFIRLPNSFKTLALVIDSPGKTMEEYGELLGISKMGVSLNLDRIEKHFGCKLYYPKFQNSQAQKRRRCLEIESRKEKKTLFDF